METRKDTYRCDGCRKIFRLSDFSSDYLNIRLRDVDDWSPGRITRQLIMDTAMLNVPVVDFNYSGRNVKDLEGDRPFERLLNPNLALFNEKYGQSPGCVLGSFFDAYLEQKDADDYDIMIWNQVDDDGIIQKSPEARICLMDQEFSHSPNLFIAVGAPFYQCPSVISFGIDYGKDVRKEDPCVSIVTRDRSISNLIDSTYNKNKKLDFGNLTHDSVGGTYVEISDRIYRRGETSFRHCWDQNCFLIEGYSFNDFPKNIESRIMKTLDDLWEIFDRLSRA